ncbi:MotA/TolQ/ExbB proton channel family protein [Gilvimarinus agarilyticus]|uniref:MotA/TolQ/ExbB proton channel family protein n=1 Tax=unclassified Gilvimarinus TaxID=2642066 RepID=UPI001C08E4EE|nr:MULTISPECIES: MotA/TolQ/ExbB proton channel family protein [unclassified Gilvimarinus]MBU2886229.1 MotA/TolQ/ExbB proton channel family protein [Gilvimarinus agarilyticus]MDO6570917.1 MotA/TolQ/ExbB proton channel family protein [Gilvimarinus sp. 2_MG-2023]MDO6747796.1 MotA/TolQ/ExbB proton channel family protein [Gilvimarinus sp. 1_MG-2023]
MDFLTTIVRFFQHGGPFMYPIALVLVIGLVIAIERYLVLASAKRANAQAFNRVMPLLKKRDYQGVVNMGRSSEAPIARIVAAGVQRMGQAGGRDDIELAMEEGVLEAMPRLEKRTPYLATLANIATLLGLLGTIIGLIAAFTAVAEADPAEKASLLSSSISVAMNTTAFGLISAIPLLLFHAMLQTKTTELVDSLEMTGVKCLNLLTASSAKPTAKASA